jgi:hypothetical protein
MMDGDGEGGIAAMGSTYKHAKPLQSFALACTGLVRYTSGKVRSKQ